MPIATKRMAKSDSSMRDIVALRRGMVLIPNGNENSVALAATLQAELMHLGFVMNSAAFGAACSAPQAWLIEFHDKSLTFLRQQLGADRAYTPFYRNFPRQVMDADLRQLFLNALVHYDSNGLWEPAQELTERGIRFEDTAFKKLRLATEADFMDVFTTLAASPQSLTPEDQVILTWFAQTYGDTLPMPPQIPFKETLCLLATHGLPVPVNQATDVLRIAVAMSGGDISLPAVPKKSRSRVARLGLSAARPQSMFDLLLGTRNLDAWHEERALALQAERLTFTFKHFGRPDRRYLLTLLEETNLDVAEMQLHLGRWLRLGEILHVGSYEAQFPRTVKAFQALRNQKTPDSKIRTFNSQVETAFREDWVAGVNLLATRPGLFARKLDWLLRTFEPGYVLPTFYRVGAKVSSKVLLELMRHFETRSDKLHVPRTIMVKGKRSKLKTLKPLPPLPEGVADRVRSVILDLVRAKIHALPALGQVWVDERLRGVPVPSAMRGMNTAVKTYVRGTRVPYRAAKVIRPFIHWYDKDGSEDLDLSASFYTEELTEAGHLSYTRLRDKHLNSCHSGDIRHRRGACAEYVDIDIQRCLNAGVRYVLVHVHNFNGRPMHTIPNTVFGLMEREHPQENEIFVPASISNCMGLANESTGVIVCVIDLKESNYIWADLESKSWPLPNIEHGRGQAAEVLLALVRGSKALSVYDLLSMHAQARGEQVDSPELADVAFRWDDFVTDYAATTKYMAF